MRGTADSVDSYGKKLTSFERSPPKNCSELIDFAFANFFTASSGASYVVDLMEFIVADLGSLDALLDCKVEDKIMKESLRVQKSMVRESARVTR